MKKKWLALILMCILLCLSACGKDDSKPGEKTTEQKEQTEQTGQEERTTEEVVIAAPPKILETGVATDETKALYYIANEELEAGSLQEMDLFGGCLLLSGSAFDQEEEKSYQELKLISLETGEVKHRAAVMDVLMATTQACGDKIFLCDAAGGKAYAFDQELNLLEEYEIMGNMAYASPDAKYIYCFTTNTGIQVLDVETGEWNVYLEETGNLFTSMKNGTYVTFSYLDKKTMMDRNAALNLADGQIETLELPEAFSAVEYHDGDWLAWYFRDADSYYLIGEQAGALTWKEEDSLSFNLLGAPSRFLIGKELEDGNSELTLCSMDGTILSGFKKTQEMLGPFNDPVWCEEAGGYFILLMDQEGKDRLYFWDTSVKTDANKLELISYQEVGELPQDVFSDEVYEMADTIGQTYGVTVKVGNQCRTSYSDKEAAQVLDEEQTKKGLTALEKVLSSYPDGFFEQLYHASYHRIEINLMGEIKNINSQAFDTVGFVNEGDGVLYLVLNINRDADDLERTAYHETSHLIEKKLIYAARYRLESFFTEDGWKALNPDSFVGYQNSYDELPMVYYNEEYDPYFIDFYSMTYMGEDMARVFENAMMGYENVFDEDLFFGCRDKLEYYCKAIRDGFDTTGWPELTKWEETLVEAGGSVK